MEQKTENRKEILVRVVRKRRDFGKLGGRHVNLLYPPTRIRARGEHG